MIRSSLVILTMGAGLALACSGSGSGDSGTDGSTGGSGSSGGSASSATSGTSSATSATSAGTASGTGTSGSTGSTGATSTGATAGSSTGGAGSCGGATCSEAEWCDWSDDTCGKSPAAEGTCEPRPQGCPDIYQPVCGCDGMVYSNACDAQDVGIDANIEGGCEPPPGMFPCGAIFCLSETDYCERVLSDVVGVPDSYHCKPATDPCGNGPVDCTCLAKAPCGDICEMTGDGYTVTCPGG